MILKDWFQILFALYMFRMVTEFGLDMEQLTDKRVA